MTELIDYLVIVGRLSDLPCSVAMKHQTPVVDGLPNILCKFPEARPSCLPLTPDVPAFCMLQEHMKTFEYSKSMNHLFMLTDKETDTKRYGTCVQFTFEHSPIQSNVEPSADSEDQLESFEVPSVGALSLAIISKFPHFRFFKECLQQLVQYVDVLFSNQMTWLDLIDTSLSSKSSADPVHDVLEWINSLVTLEVPAIGELLEVELSIAPPIKVYTPPPHRLPLADLPFYRLFDALSVDNVLKIFTLLLCEEKVVVHSRKFALVSEAVLTLVHLLYPFGYLYPVVPLLPTALPEAENLLHVPTPYLIGVHSSFLDKLEENTDIWLVSLDEDKVLPPEAHCRTPELPTSHFELKADIQKALANLSKPSSVTHDEVDTLIRVAFVKFLLAPDMLSCILHHMYIIRLFPRPTISLKSHSFSNEYRSIVRKMNSSTEFVERILSSQCIRNFLEWTLNPDNTAYISIIQKNVTDPSFIGSSVDMIARHEHLMNHSEMLFDPTRTPLLYQVLLSNRGFDQTSLGDGEGYVMAEDSDDPEGGESWVLLTPTEGVSTQKERKVSESTDGHCESVSMEMTQLPSVQDTNAALTQMLLKETKRASTGSFILQPQWPSPVATPPPSPDGTTTSTPNVSKKKESSYDNCQEVVSHIVDGSGLRWIKRKVEGLASTEAQRVNLLNSLRTRLQTLKHSKDGNGTQTAELFHVGVHKLVFMGICELLKVVWKGFLADFRTSLNCKMKSIYLLLQITLTVYLDEKAPKGMFKHSPSVMVATSGSLSISESDLFPSSANSLDDRKSAVSEYEDPSTSQLFLDALEDSGSLEMEESPQSDTPLPQSDPPLQQSNPPLQQSDPPLPQSNPPLQQSDPPLQQSDPPLQQSDPPLPQSNPPLQQSDPPLQQSDPPLQQSDPPLQQSDPPLQQSNPPLQQSDPPLQQSDPPLQQSDPPLQQSDPPLQQSDPPLQQSDPPLQQSDPPLQQSDPPLPQSNPPLQQSDPPLQQSDPPLQQSELESNLSSHQNDLTPSHTVNADMFHTPLLQAKHLGIEEPDGSNTTRRQAPNSVFEWEKRIPSEPLPFSILRSQPLDQFSGLIVYNLPEPEDDSWLKRTYILRKLEGTITIKKEWSHQFWNNLTWSMVTGERDLLGWNEKTSDLCKRFQSSSESTKRKLISEEDQIITSVIVNIALFMSMFGTPVDEIREHFYRSIAKSRISDREGTIVSCLLRELMNMDNEDVPLLDKFRLLPLYSELNSPICFMVHRGTDITGQVLSLTVCQDMTYFVSNHFTSSLMFSLAAVLKYLSYVTNSACLLRKFPANDLLHHLWIDSITGLNCLVQQQVIHFYHKETNGSQTLLQFYSKECEDICQAILARQRIPSQEE